MQGYVRRWMSSSECEGKTGALAEVPAPGWWTYGVLPVHIFCIGVHNFIIRKESKAVVAL